MGMWQCPRKICCCNIDSIPEVRSPEVNSILQVILAKTMKQVTLVCNLVISPPNLTISYEALARIISFNMQFSVLQSHISVHIYINVINLKQQLEKLCIFICKL